jgi:Holliday junction resolvase RusA-like endonuclease
MIYSYRIPEIPPSNNKFIGRNARWEYQAEKKRWAQMVQFLCCPKPLKPISKSIVRLTYHFENNIRRDPDNYSGKMILDGLVRAGILADDSFNCIELQLAAVYDKSGYTEIFIEEAKS